MKRLRVSRTFMNSMKSVRQIMAQRCVSVYVDMGLCEYCFVLVFLLSVSVSVSGCPISIYMHTHAHAHTSSRTMMNTVMDAFVVKDTHIALLQVSV